LNKPSYYLKSKSWFPPNYAFHVNSLKQLTTQKQLPDELKVVFNELKRLQYLRQAGIKRKFGFTWDWLFQIIFCL